jgi:hypothetical protein
MTCYEIIFAAPRDRLRKMILFFRLKGGKHISESSLLRRLESKKTSTVSIELAAIPAISLRCVTAKNGCNINIIQR